jgi:hypothetical protein
MATEGMDNNGAVVNEAPRLHIYARAPIDINVHAEKLQHGGHISHHVASDVFSESKKYHAKLQQGTAYVRVPSYDAAGADVMESQGSIWHLGMFASNDGETGTTLISNSLTFRVVAIQPSPPSHIMLVSRTHNS